MNDDQENRIKDIEGELPELDPCWNYRIVKKTHDYDSIVNPGEKHVTFGIHEVYYRNGEPSMTTVDPMKPQGETLDELKEDVQHFLAALDKPVLNFEDF